MSVNGEDIAAKQYYDSIKDKITNKDDILSIEKTLEAGSMRGESQRQSDQIVSAHKDMASAVAAAREIEDPKLQDETLKRVKDYFADQQIARKTDNENNFNNASMILEKSGRIDAIPPQIMANLPSDQKRSLEVRYTQIRDGIEPEANSETKYNLQQMAATPELRDKFLQTNLLEYRHQVTHSELSQLMTLQQSMRKSDGNADDSIRGLRTRVQVVNQTLAPLGISEKNDPDNYLKINRMLDDQIQEFAVNNGKKPGGQDIQKMLDNVIVKAKDPNSGLFGMFNSGRAFEFDQGAKLSVDASDIPVSEKNQIVQALKARNIPVTDDKIEELYARKINGMRSRGQ